MPEHMRRPIALVTGGSKGIGLALAGEFGRHGRDLILVARDGAALELAASDLRQTIGGGAAVSTFAADLSLEETPGQLFRWAAENGLQVDVLVNNAGIGDHGDLATTDPVRQRKMLRVNIEGLTELTRLFLDPMLRRGRGRILNVASIAAYFAGGPHWASYVASKGYVLSFTRGLQTELKGTGVTATALSPGTTGTDFVDDAGVGRTRAYRWLPRLSVDDVAKAGYHATTRGRKEIVPGFANKVLAFLGELHPRGVAQGVFGFLSRSARA